MSTRLARVLPEPLAHVQAGAGIPVYQTVVVAEIAHHSKWTAHDDCR
jgi:hypothetical protein